MKKITKKLFGLVALFLISLTISGCLEEGKVLEFVQFPQSVYVYDKDNPKMDLTKVTIKIGGDPYSLDKVPDYVKVTGYEWNEAPKAGEPDIYTLKVSSDNMTIAFSYKVINSADVKPDDDKTKIDIEWELDKEDKTNKTYLLTSEAELRGLAAVVNDKAGEAASNIAGQNTHFDGYTFKVQVPSGEINLKEAWEPIGEGFRKQQNKIKYFSGTIDGRQEDGSSLIIKGMTNVGYNPSYASGSYEASLGANVKEGYVYGFIGLSYGATVKNINFSDVNIEGLTVVSTEENVKAYVVDASGAAIGYVACKHDNGDTFTNAKVSEVKNVQVTSGKISGFDAAAGICGRAYQPVKITDCVNRANISISRYENGKCAGIIGAISRDAKGSEFIGCSNYGQVINTGGIYVAGIGSHLCIDCTVKNCHNYGLIYGLHYSDSEAPEWLNNIYNGTKVVDGGGNTTIEGGLIHNNDKK